MLYPEAKRRASRPTRTCRNMRLDGAASGPLCQWALGKDYKHGGLENVWRPASSENTGLVPVDIRSDYNDHRIDQNESGLLADPPWFSEDHLYDRPVPRPLLDNVDCISPQQLVLVPATETWSSPATTASRDSAPDTLLFDSSQPISELSLSPTTIDYSPRPLSIDESHSPQQSPPANAPCGRCSFSAVDENVLA